eukprot:6175499-Pleurochrysis_carterae.AAC.1
MQSRRRLHARAFRQQWMGRRPLLERWPLLSQRWDLLQCLTVWATARAGWCSATSTSPTRHIHRLLSLTNSTCTSRRDSACAAPLSDICITH